MLERDPRWPDTRLCRVLWLKPETLLPGSQDAQEEVAMPHGRERELGPIWCPHCEKVTDHRMSQLSRVDRDDLPLEPADPPLGTRYIVTCLTCGIIHSWWARPAAR